MREAEAVSDEAMVAFSKLKTAMLLARQNPELPVDVGQRALMRVSQIEQQAMGMSTNLLRVHDELSKIAREFAGGDGGDTTNISPSALGMVVPSEEKEPA
uniref:hypothetical protein n=1 Tax=Parerythrobacter lutipelagi TaxID=1964208 RepID=UPI001F00BDC7|nr:hypothetical protein [Parerythrobacter lutipelagi]